jgi:hypothetical protein
VLEGWSSLRDPAARFRSPAKQILAINRRTCGDAATTISRSASTTSRRSLPPDRERGEDVRAPKWTTSAAPSILRRARGITSSWCNGSIRAVSDAQPGPSNAL